MADQHDLSASHEDGQSKKSLEKPFDREPSRADGTVTSVVNMSSDNQSDVATNLGLVDEAIEAIGFGKYQWQLTFTCGFGFLVDQMLLVSISLVTPQAALEFGPKYATLLSASLYSGLLIGALTLGALADNFGRRLIWQLSIFAVSIATLCAASSPNWAALNVWVALAGYFGGGNLAIDLTILAESIPRNWSFILSGLASVWGLGNAITGLIAWPLLVNLGCPPTATPATCSKSDNMGWRYLYIILGALCILMSLVRALVLRSRESPRWLVSCGRTAEAVEVLNRISTANGSTHTVSVNHFIPGTMQNVQTKSVKENVHRAARLFKGPGHFRLMVSISMLWILIGIAYPLYTIFLPYYLAANGAKLGETSNYITYRDWTVSSIVGIFGPLLSMWMVSTRWLRSRITLALTGAACVAFSAAFTTVRTPGQNLAFSSMINFWLNALYAVIYAYTPQALAVENRGLGTGFAMAMGRLASLSAPFIATFADVTTSAPIWVSCGCYVVIGLIGVSLPVDTQSFRSKVG